jgi:hypothetical protein
MTGLSPELAVRQIGLDGDFAAKIAVTVIELLRPSTDQTRHKP